MKKFLDAFGCKVVINKVRQMESFIVIMRYPNLFEFWLLLGNVWNEFFKHILIVFLLYSSLWCHTVWINKAITIEECDTHHVSTADYCWTFSFYEEDWFFLWVQIRHQIFDACYRILKQIWLLLKRLKPFLTNVNASCHLFMCEQMRYPHRWCTLHLEIVCEDMVKGWLGNVHHVVWILNCQMLSFQIIFTLTCVIWLTGCPLDFCKVKLCILSQYTLGHR